VLFPTTGQNAIAANVPVALRGGGFTNVPAGDKRANSHKIVCGGTAAILQNRPLWAGLFTHSSHFQVAKTFKLPKKLFITNSCFLIIGWWAGNKMENGISHFPFC